MTTPANLPSGSPVIDLVDLIARAHPQYSPEQAQRAAEVIAQAAHVKADSEARK